MIMVHDLIINAACWLLRLPRDQLIHKVIQCNQVRRYAQGTYNQDHVSILPAISDAILWKAGAADCEMWDGHCHSF
ncbi:hypothetical protein TIFTF001_052589 [Ficus carica]|uniref:Uncharacterized protein n=1 Tax=Ficus carica TaxID=3494 RepID=A0AA88JFW5_FICCA|nr:hypothetical protein TIFTF001_052589 [Ficus carica]